MKKVWHLSKSPDESGVSARVSLTPLQLAGWANPQFTLPRYRLMTGHARRLSGRSLRVRHGNRGSKGT